MTTKEREAEFQQVMFSLVGNPHFQRYIEFLKTQRENVMIEAASDRVISDARLLKTYLGSIRTYTEQIDHYESFVQAAEEKAVTDREDVG